MSEQPVYRDERTAAMENASYRLGYMVMSFGLLLDVAYRGFFMGESSWDLLGLVILGGAAATFYQGINRTLSRRWLVAAIIVIVAAGALAGVLAAVLR